MSEEAAVTVSFLTLGFAQLWHVFNMRALDAGLFRNEVTENLFVWGALLICIGLIGAAVYLPGLSRVLGMTPIDATGWALVAGGSLVPLILGQVAGAILLRVRFTWRPGEAPRRRRDPKSGNV